MDLLTKDKVIFSLVRKNGQTFSELRTSAETNDNSLSRALDYLKKEKLIKQEDKLYYFATGMRNHLLRSLEGSYSMAKKLAYYTDGLKTGKVPFEVGSHLITQILLLQSKLKVERYSTLKLTKREKLEFDLYGDIFDAVLEMIFDILRKKNKKKFSNLKGGLMKILGPPKTL